MAGHAVKSETCPECGSEQFRSFGRPRDINIRDQMLRTYRRDCLHCGYRVVVVSGHLTGRLLEAIANLVLFEPEVAA